MTVTTDTPTDPYTELRNEVREAARELHRLPGNPHDAHIEATTEELMSLLASAWFMGNHAAASGDKNPFVRSAL